MKASIIKKALICLLCLCILGAAAFGIYKYRDEIFPTDRISEAIERGEVVICFIDVGQADSILIMTPDGNMLIDAGTTESQGRLKAFLNEQGIGELEYFVLTHPHDDHIGGASMVIDGLKVKNVVLTEAKDTPELLEPLYELIEAKGINIIRASAGTSISLGGTVSKILSPIDDVEDYDGANDTSIVFRMQIGNCSVLFMGDAEADVESQLLQGNIELLDCDILKLGHHGSKTSSTYAFLNAVSPKYAVASCGDGNRYGHPAGETVYKLDILGIELLRTDREGDIFFACDGEVLEYIK